MAIPAARDKQPCKGTEMVRLKRLCFAMEWTDRPKLDRLPSASMLVRANKYLGMYRHKALPHLTASRANPSRQAAVRRSDIVESSGYPV